MTKRSDFQPNEWELIRQTPFWLWRLLCGETDHETSQQTADFLTAEIAEPRLFPPLARIAFQSAVRENPAPFQVQPAANVWQTAFAALRTRATLIETVQFQMSLGTVGRNLIKNFNGKLSGRAVQHLRFDQIGYFRLEQLWRELNFDDSTHGARAFEAIRASANWQHFQLAPMHVWLFMSLLDGQFTNAESAVLKNAIVPLFPPESRFLLIDTERNLNSYYAHATRPNHADSIGYLKIAGQAADALLSPASAQIFKMSLLLLARDVADANAPAVNNAKPLFAEMYFDGLSRISGALNLHNPISTNAAEKISNAAVPIAPPQNPQPTLQERINPLLNTAQEKLNPILNTAVDKIGKSSVKVRQNLQAFFEKTFDQNQPPNPARQTDYQAKFMTDQTQFPTNGENAATPTIESIPADAPTQNAPETRQENNSSAASAEQLEAPVLETAAHAAAPESAQNALPEAPETASADAAENLPEPEKTAPDNIAPTEIAPVETSQNEFVSNEVAPSETALDGTALNEDGGFAADEAASTQNAANEIDQQNAATFVMPEIDLGEIEREIAETIPASLASFADYKKTIAAVNNDLRNLLEIADEIKLENAGALVKDMIRRVEDNNFSIAVVGEFKRGKSTFINALLGKDILPSDILPCSATLNRVTYGIKPGVLVKYKDGREESVEIDKLPDYVTKLTEESEELAATVKEAIVTYPIPYCQNNVEIIDTPGLNDDANMTDVTLSVLPHVDAAILVIMANSPFSEYERDFLENKLLTSDLGRVIFLVTAIDRLNNPEKDAERVVKAIRDRIRKHVLKRAAEQFGAESEEYEVYLRKIGEPRVFPVSPYQALQAKERGDANLMALSRFEIFEKALEKFLSEERGAVFLQVPINRLLSASHDVLSAFKIREGALSMQTVDFDQAYQKTLQEIEILRERKDDEMQKVDDAARAVENDIKPLISELDEIFRQSAADVIDNADFTETEIATKESTAKLIERINTDIQSATQTASKTQLEKIQLQVQRGVTAEAMRWGDFSEAMSQMSRGIEGRFGVDEAASNENAVTQGAGIIATIMGFGGAYTGYQVAGWKGAAAGGAASIGVGIGTAIALTVVAGTVLALPVLIVGTLLALPAGSWLTKKIFGGEKIKTFRESLKKQVLENLERQLAAGSVEQKIIQEIDRVFDDLKTKIHREVEATLSDTEKTLQELRLKRERDEVLSETERRRLYKMRRETLKIQKRAAKLNDLLLQVTAV